MFTDKLQHREPTGRVCPECGSDDLGDEVHVVEYSDPGYPHLYESVYWCREPDCTGGPWHSVEDLPSLEEFEAAQENEHV